MCKIYENPQTNFRVGRSEMRRREFTSTTYRTSVAIVHSYLQGAPVVGQVGVVEQGLNLGGEKVDATGRGRGLTRETHHGDVAGGQHLQGTMGGHHELPAVLGEKLQRYSKGPFNAVTL